MLRYSVRGRCGARTAGGKAAAVTSRRARLFYRHIYVIEHLCYNPPNVKSPEAGGGNNRPHNLDFSTLRVSPEKKPSGWGLKKPESQNPQEPNKSFFRRPYITEAERVINRRFATYKEIIERYPPDQQEKITSEWFDRVTSRFKPQELTPQILIETLKMLEEGIERASMEPLDVEPQANQHSNTSTGQETS